MSVFALPSDPPELTDPNAALAAAESGYIAPDVETDQAAIAQQVFASLMAKVPGWIAHDGNLDTWLIEAFSEAGAEVRSLAVDVPTSIFSTYGTRILNIPPRIAMSATGLATFIAVDDMGYTVDTGATFALARSGNDLVAYQTLQQAVIPPGSNTVTDVPFSAVETGYNGNGLAGDGQMLDALRWVSSVTVPVETSNGQDAERPEDYVDRLANLFPAVALRPILPLDFAILTLNLIPDVGRAVAMNLYDPALDTWDNVRTVTVMVTKADGTVCSTPTKQEIELMLEALREINWVCHVIDPVYEPIDVTFDVVAFVGQDDAAVLASATADVTEYLQPYNYRLGEMSPAIAGGEVINPPMVGEIPRRQVIYINELIALLDRSLGVDRVVDVTINGSPADFTLTSPYSLPSPGTVTGTVGGGNV